MKALITNIQGFSIHDGPGIRTLVFLKGCSLACRWCANPETISPQKELGHLEQLCTGCGKCIVRCPEQALRMADGGRPHIDRKRCTACGECATNCAVKALVIYGEEMGVREVFDQVMRDSLFYDESGGGVTVSGGEPLLHAPFVRELFGMCRSSGIHTCMETSGNAEESVLRELLPVTDYVLFDLKHQDATEHRKLTGKSNENVLRNARTVVGSGVDFLFRLPLIPGLNDGTENILATARFLKELGEPAQRIELMPFHRIGSGKYKALTRENKTADLAAAGSEQVEAVRLLFEEQGIRCLVSH
ncbi:MAG: glycyl-radical enzyme activating protein [Desulfuromonadaceae bacterium]|nr:glycyl-radical enzyme activating protein [Desulfuromonadaceae bacterium]